MWNNQFNQFGQGFPNQQNMYQQYKRQGFQQQQMQQVNPMYQQQMNAGFQQQVNPMYQQQQMNPAFNQQQVNPMYQQQMQQVNPMYQQQMYPMYQQQMMNQRMQNVQTRMQNIGFGQSGMRMPASQPVAGPMGFDNNFAQQQQAQQTVQQQTCNPAKQIDRSNYKPETGHEYPPLYDETKEILEIVFDDIKQTYKFIVKNKNI